MEVNSGKALGAAVGFVVGTGVDAVLGDVMEAVMPEKVKPLGKLIRKVGVAAVSSAVGYFAKDGVVKTCVDIKEAIDKCKVVFDEALSQIPQDVDDAVVEESEEADGGN